MEAVAPPGDQASELLQKLSLDAKPKPVDIPDHTEKTPANQLGSVDVASVPSGGPMQPYERSLTPILPDFTDPAVYYIPNGYSSAPFYYGGMGRDWDEYSRYSNSEGVAMNSGFFGDNGSLMHHGYGYSPYAPYLPAASPVPTSDHLYGTQQYQYPSPYFQSLTSSSAPFSPSPVAPTTEEVMTSASSDQKSLTADTIAVNSNGTTNAVKGNGRSTHPKSSNQNSSFNSKASLHGGMASGYQDLRFGVDGMQSIPWLETALFFDEPVGPMTTSMMSNQRSRNQTFRPNSNYMGPQRSRPISGVGADGGFVNGMYPNKLFDHYGGNFRSSMSLESYGFDSRTGGRAWVSTEKFRNRGQGCCGYKNDNMDGLNELNRGPRAKSTKNQKSSPPTQSAKGQSLPSHGSVEEENNQGISIPDRGQFNNENFAEEYTDAKFFVIKSYSEDDVHKSVKYNVWASTPTGNQKLDAAYREAQENSSGCPIFLFFSVNASGQFVGLAEMVGPVDFQKNVEYWQQDKWNGQFPVKWHIIKDVPNSLLKYIILENNENKPVTNSRDTQEVKLAQGLKMIKIFKENPIKTCLLDDFEFYENRQKVVQEKKAKQLQLQLQKQVWEGKPLPDKDTATNGELKSQKHLEETTVVEANGNVTNNGIAVQMVDGPKGMKAAVPE